MGEALWDSTPAGLFLGGAPLNVAIHLSRQGVEVELISSVGTDRLGNELLSRLQDEKVGITFIKKDPEYETGFVTAAIEENGDAKYIIVENVAWDFLPEAPKNAKHTPRAIVYSSLGMRHSESARKIDEWLSVSGDAMRVFDVNLRAPHFDRKNILYRMNEAHFIKSNREEALFLLGLETAPPPKVLAEKLMALSGAKVICLTCDSQGAGMLIGERWYWAAGKKVPVVDTIGAGDSFLATLLVNWLIGNVSPKTALELACRVAESVVQSNGATP